MRSPADRAVKRQGGLNRLFTLTHRNPSDNVIFGQQFGYDANSNIGRIDSSAGDRWLYE